MNLDGLLDPPPGPAQHDHRGNRHDHSPTIDRDPLTGDLLVSGIVSATLPDSVDEWTAQVKALGLNVPDGYVVEMVSAKHDPVAWTRSAQGEDAVTAAAWRCSYRVMRDPRLWLKQMRELLDEPERPRHLARGHDKSTVFVAPVSDRQLGKQDGGGTEATVKRFLSELDRVVTRYQALTPGAPVVLPHLGDDCEGLTSQGGACKGRSDLGVTKQALLAHRLVCRTVDAYLEAGAPDVLVPVVGGNHDQPSRTAGTVDTDLDDSYAILAGKTAADVFRQDERVRWLFPDRDHTTVTLPVAGMVVGLAHGDQFRGGFEKWWAGQAAGRTRIGDADLLLAGHLHHLRVQDFGGGRTFMQLPALDGGSRWYQETHGDSSRSRMLSFTIRDGRVGDLDPVS